MTEPCYIANLPTELLQQIFHQLREEKGTLSSCTLVCKLWSQCARPYLFREVTVAPHAVPEIPHPEYPELALPDWEAANRFFSDATDLAGHVQVLHIEGEELPMDKTILDEYDEIEFEYVDGKKTARELNYSYVDLASLLSVAQVFPNLKRTTMDTLIVKPVPLPSNYQPVQIDMLEMNDVGTVGGENPFIIFRVFHTTAIDLNIFYRPNDKKVWPEAFAYESSVTTSKWIVRAEPSAAPILRGLAASSQGHLTSLTLDVRDEHDLQALIDAFKAFGTQFKELVLDLWDATWVAKPHVVIAPALEEFWVTKFTINAASGLETFELHFKLGFVEDSFQFLECVAYTLTTLPPSIRTVRLVIDFVYYEHDVVPEIPWSTIGRALTMEKFEKLEKVSLIIVDGGSGLEDENEDYVRGILTSQLSDVERLLDIEFID